MSQVDARLTRRVVAEHIRKVLPVVQSRPHHGLQRTHLERAKWMAGLHGVVGAVRLGSSSV